MVVIAVEIRFRCRLVIRHPFVEELFAEDEGALSVGGFVEETADEDSVGNDGVELRGASVADEVAVEVEVEDEEECDGGMRVSRGMCLAACNSACVKLNRGGNGLWFGSTVAGSRKSSKNECVQASIGLTRCDGVY